MVEISLTDDHIHLEVKGLDKLWAFRSQLDIPLAHIRGVRHDPDAASGWFHGIKVCSECFTRWSQYIPSLPSDERTEKEKARRQTNGV
jgi:hypothetical protein